MRTRQKLAALAAGAVLALVGPAAFADIVYNDLDNTIDSNLETLNLTYDSVAQTGTSGTTTLAIQVEGHPDHPGCNIQGANFVGLAPVLGTPGVASVTLSNDGVFDACTDTVVATVQAIGLGSTTVSFVVDASKTSNDPHLVFSLGQASFQVNVTEGTTQPPVGCDADPAAPAWAAAILQKSGVKANTKNYTNYISTIANEMTNGAVFAGYAKNAHPQYENAVQARLVTLTGKSNLATAQAAARPGWVCTSQ